MSAEGAGSARLHEVLDAIPDAIAVLGPGGTVELANRAMRELFAAFGVEAIGLAAVSPERPVRGRLELAAGRRKFVTSAAALGPSGRVVVTLRELGAERDGERLREDLFGLVSHELRTPLASIIGYLDLAREDAVGEQRGFLNVVDRNARRLLRLVDDLLFSAQVEVGQVPLTRTEFDLREPVQEAVEAARPRARARGIRLELEVDRSTLCPGDRDRVTQVVDNLIGNALKFTPPGGEVAVRLTTAGRDAIVEISDSGPGVPADEQAKLFERFYRAPEAVEQAVPGVGLGLSIVKAIVEAHRGRIGVRGNPSGGATFELALPVLGSVKEGAQLATGRSSRDSEPPSPCSTTRGGR